MQRILLSRNVTFSRVALNHPNSLGKSKFCKFSSTNSNSSYASESRNLIKALVSNLGSGGIGAVGKGVEDLALAYGLSSLNSAPLVQASVRPLIIVKVGGEVITKDIDSLISSVKVLISSGLFPVIVHGGGPQLNDELAKAGVKPEYIGGHRVTDAATMAVAKRVFESANSELADALERSGVPTERIRGGVFGAEVANPKLGLVGEINSVHKDIVEKALSAGRVPVLTSLGFSSTGSTLNINADVAAREVAVALKPTKVVFISAGGGWKEEGVVVPEIDMARDYDRLVNRDYNGRQGTLLKLKEVKMITDKLPPASSVTIASASALSEQLLPHRGPGTQIRRGQKLNRFDTVGACDVLRLSALLSSCGQTEAILLVNDKSQHGLIDAIFISEDYTACAIVTKTSTPSLHVLHTLSCLPLALAEGAESALWSAAKAKYTSLSWLGLASKATKVALAEVEEKGFSHIPMAFPPLSVGRSMEHAEGMVPLPSSSSSLTDNNNKVMWFGKGVNAEQAIAAIIARKSINHSSSSSSSTTATFSPSPSSSSTPIRKRDIRVGLLGARGFVGRELLRLIKQHPRLEVVCASSRALVGQSIADGIGLPEAAEACSPGLKFVDVGPDQLKKGAHEAVDVWVLALPNGLAAPHVQAIEARCKETGSKLPLLIDLSADMRFEATESSGGWVYGLPERHGARALIQTAKRISNPGCYATGAQTALMPLCKGPFADSQFGFSWDPSQKPHVFGVSGYSGAGTSPSDKNDPNRLRDNLLPYALVNHIHEREISLHCGFNKQVNNPTSSSSSKAVGSGVAFMPHVAPFFQGISLTVTGHILPTRGGSLSKVTVADLHKTFAEYYKNDKLVKVLPLGVTPDVRAHQQSSNVHGVTVGGFSYDPITGRVAVVSCIDNLLKGAATQAVQNINLALGLDELAGIPV